jgi:hypothetical protein
MQEKVVFVTQKLTLIELNLGPNNVRLMFISTFYVLKKLRLMLILTFNFLRLG